MSHISEYPGKFCGIMFTAS